MPFAPSISVVPTSDVAESPAGLDLSLDLPQHEGCEEVEDEAKETEVRCERATSPLREATVTLPRGMTVNPASANGLDACAPAQISLGTDDPVACPDGSQIGSVKVTTPLLHDPVAGRIYLATPHDNPFGTLLAGYIVLAEPDRGILVKLPGRIEADPATGQLTGSFAENPELPFSELELHFQADALLDPDHAARLRRLHLARPLHPLVWHRRGLGRPGLCDRQGPRRRLPRDGAQLPGL